MFITVMFGAGCRELVNPWCRLVTLTAHLRQRGRVPPDDGEGGAPTRYESLLENLDDRCPELAEALRRLSGLPPLGNSRRRRNGTRTGTRRGHQDQGPLLRSQRLGSLLSRPR
ncbi:uncharacterized protein C22orf15 homolog [Myotis lucifugus]|uniref:uncharacterized protein C22orf15 homolog n=1 Tax=Myotis lucifugus TaxID=59463 RepID=UPI0003C4A51E|nr:uncharacterized protein C22orf15 homolog [Myotis lucifugus]